MTTTDVKQMARDPRLYYILIPCLAALWPLWVELVAMNSSQDKWEKTSKSYHDAQKIMLSIKDLDPERLKSKNANQAQFSYPTVVDSVVRSAGIPASEYKVQASPIIKVVAGQESQDADITLKQVDMATFAKFLTLMQFQGASLQCTSLKLTKQKGAADLWKAEMKFRYYKG
ncbi:MAG: hypothetical protein A2178_00465 [Planctomycetes bacterium GWC2_49_10]|nr:MAG: hypothetical protein A2178_00465 [Planctomycetes bacterium GWC2_49_10]